MERAARPGGVASTAPWPAGVAPFCRSGTDAAHPTNQLNEIPALGVPLGRRALKEPGAGACPSRSRRRQLGTAVFLHRWPGSTRERLLAQRFATIGHSNRPPELVVEMLRAACVDLLVDVRAFPRSRSNPRFNIDQLPAHLAEFQIAYEHMPALGGRRPRQPEVDESCNSLWRVRSFHNYADYAFSDSFETALRTLIRFGQDHRIALMCSEAVWWRCHRRIITDYLLLRGHAVDHLMAPGRTEAASLTEGAILTPRDKVQYPATTARGRNASAAK